MFGSSKNVPETVASAVATSQAVWHPDQLPHIQVLLAAIECAQAPVDREDQRAQELADTITKQSAQLADLDHVKKDMLARWVKDPSFVDEDQELRDTQIAKCQRALLDMRDKEKALISTRVNNEVDEGLKEAKSAYEAAVSKAKLDRVAYHHRHLMEGFVDLLLTSYAERVNEGFVVVNRQYGVRDLMNAADDARRHLDFVSTLAAAFRAKFGQE